MPLPALQTNLIFVSAKLVRYARKHAISLPVLLDRHITGDWGVVGTAQRARNRTALQGRGVVTSCFPIWQVAQPFAVHIDTDLATRTSSMRLVMTRNIFGDV